MPSEQCSSAELDTVKKSGALWCPNPWPNFQIASDATVKVTDDVILHVRRRRLSAAETVCHLAPWPSVAVITGSASSTGPVTAATTRTIHTYPQTDRDLTSLPH